MANVWRRNPSSRLITANFVRCATGNAGPSVADDFFEASGIVYNGILYRWTGAAWIKAKLMRWTGATWVAATLKRWTGSAWVDVDATGI